MNKPSRELFEDQPDDRLEDRPKDHTENQPKDQLEDQPENQPKDQLENQSESRSAAERVSFFVALAILLGIVSGVGYLWVSDRNQSLPVLKVSTSRTEQRQADYYVPFTVTNLGGKTAATVQVTAELRINSEVVESGEQIIDFLSREEEATGAFIFVRNPNEGELTIRVASYSEP
ncbi:MAG: TIGR02588 family protein [Phormidesmis sp.]